MKHIYFLSACQLFSTLCSAQTPNETYEARSSITYNNVNAMINSNGVFGYDAQLGRAAYEVPDGGGASAMYFSSLQMYAADANGQSFAAVSEYSLSDFSAGPIADNYTDTANYLIPYRRLWTAYRWEIDMHILHHNDPNYVTPQSILIWPGNGNTANGEAAILAPFADLNNNGIYEPVSGEYPVFRSDYAIYSIINSQRMAGPFGHSRPALEIHLMYYQYPADDAINNMTFVHATVYNRSTVSYPVFQVGVAIDFDLGNYADDYLGTSVTQQTAYVYNGDNNDEAFDNFGGSYGPNPPAFGLVALQGNLYSHVYNVSPWTQVDTLQRLMNGLQASGEPMTDQSNAPTRFAYLEENTEESAENVPGDRKSFISFEPQSLEPGGWQCYDYAFVYGKTNGINSSVAQMLQAAALAQNLYDSVAHPCGNGTLGIEDLEPVGKLSLYPNPACNTIHVDHADSGTYHIISTDGRMQASGQTSDTIDISALAPGIYTLVLTDSGVPIAQRFVKMTE
jgi:hypothetical protein